MSEDSNPLEKITKLPFANYDIVVYFGIGICSLPLLNHYFLRPGQGNLPPIFNAYGDALINSVVSIIALAFAVYIIGHGIAILSALFIEQFVYRLVGPPSVILLNGLRPGPFRGQGFRGRLLDRIANVLWPTFNMADVARLSFHLPVLPVYSLMFLARFHGFYESKLNSFVVLRVQSRLEENFDFKDSILGDIKWFKMVEYSCANDHSAAMSKMYNYLVIYGLFRSTAFLLLLSIWLELFFVYWVGGIGFVDQVGHGNVWIRLSVLYGAYLVSFVGFAKFSRRYTEEAVQAFALSKVFCQD